MVRNDRSAPHTFSLNSSVVDGVWLTCRDSVRPLSKLDEQDEISYLLSVFSCAIISLCDYLNTLTQDWPSFYSICNGPVKPD